MKREIAEKRGRRGEGWAALWFRLHGWRIVARRVKTPRGEIDLVARRGRTVAFVEVKWRASDRELDTAIDAYRLRRQHQREAGIARDVDAFERVHLDGYT